MNYFIALLLTVAAPTLFTNPCSAQSSATKPVQSDIAFNTFLIKWESAYNAFINGDPKPWKIICSQTDDASIFGGFGGYEKGWKQVAPRYDWAASQFKKSGAKVVVEYINVILTENLAYVILIERANPVIIGNMEKPFRHVLRSTQIFRKENGDWKLLHRHADQQVEKIANANKAG